MGLSKCLICMCHKMQISCFSFQTVVQRNCPEKLCNNLVREHSLSLTHKLTQRRRCICFLFSRKEGKLFNGSLTIDWPSAWVGFLKACSGTHIWVCHSPSLRHLSTRYVWVLFGRDSAKSNEARRQLQIAAFRARGFNLMSFQFTISYIWCSLREVRIRRHLITSNTPTYSGSDGTDWTFFSTYPHIFGHWSYL